MQLAQLICQLNAADCLLLLIYAVSGSCCLSRIEPGTLGLPAAVATGGGLCKALSVHLDGGAYLVCGWVELAALLLAGKPADAARHLAQHKQHKAMSASHLIVWLIR